MDEINNLLSLVNSFIWGVPLFIILVGTGLFATIGLKLRTISKFWLACKMLFERSDSKTEGSVSPFNALMTALAATVGTGNIAGVATAITLGGPGAIFYMWLIALFSMATQYIEAVCALQYREKDSSGNYVGGPMYYLRNGVGKKFPNLGKILACMFALFGAIAAFGIGNAAQIHSMADVIHASFNVPTIVTGSIVAIVCGLVIIGGIKHIADVAGKLVPFMIVLYISCMLIVLFLNLTNIPDAFALIFTHAFTPVAATGGFVGASVAAAIRFGVARSVLSSEAGLGSAAIAHAAANNHPIKQGNIAMLGTFLDTIVICTLTALCILVSGEWTSGVSGAPLTSLAVENSIIGGNYVVAIVLVLCAFTTLLSWSYYGEKCWQYLFGDKIIMFYRLCWVSAIFWFANQKINFIWNLADILNGLMALPNLIGIIILAPAVFKITTRYWNDKK